jgi:hypothetical protein
MVKNAGKCKDTWYGHDAQTMQCAEHMFNQTWWRSSNSKLLFWLMRR